MTSPRLVLVLLTALSSSSVSGHPAGGRDKHASWDDVNVVAHGLLQLGTALKEHVERSKAQVRELKAGLKEVNATLEGLKEMEGQRMRVRMDRLEKKVEEVISQSSLERNHKEDTERLMVSQNRRIDQLMEKIQQQQDKLDKQSVHLQALQSKVGHKRMKSYRRKHDERAMNGQQKGFAKDCHELFVQGQTSSGVYTIQPQNSHPFSVLCHMTQEGGWTVIQKRYDGSQSFDQKWDNYKKGFGSLNGEFWLGLNNIQAISRQGQYVLQVEVSDWSKESHVASSEFVLDGEEQQFSLHLKESIMETGSSALAFSTVDRDNDLSVGDNCAQIHLGGWWFSGCGGSNLNGKFPSSPGDSQSMFWTTTEGQTPLTSTVMKIAPASIKQ